MSKKGFFFLGQCTKLQSPLPFTKEPKHSLVVLYHFFSAFSIVWAKTQWLSIFNDWEVSAETAAQHRCHCLSCSHEGQLPLIVDCSTPLLQLFFVFASKRLLIWLGRNGHAPLLSQPSLSASTESRVTGEIVGDRFLAAVRRWRTRGGRLASNNKTLARKRPVLFSQKDQILLTGCFGAGRGGGHFALAGKSDTAEEYDKEIKCTTNR